MTAVKADAVLRRPACAPVPAPTLSHAEIIEGVLRGQAAANAALYDTLRPVVVRSLERVLRERRVDEDLVQTCFERIVSTLIEKRGSIVSLTAWAGGISAHVAVDALRARVRERRIFEPEEPNAQLAQGGSNPEGQVEAKRRIAWLHGLLARMKPKHAETMLLHDVFGHDLDEVALLTGVTPSAAQRRLSRARQDLLRRANKPRANKQQGATS